MSTVADLLRKPDAKDTVLKTVQLDGQVVLKIMQHCDGALPNVVTGQLLGLDVGQTMEVTDCFPFPVSHYASGSLPRVFSSSLLSQQLYRLQQVFTWPTFSRCSAVSHFSGITVAPK